MRLKKPPILETYVRFDLEFGERGRPLEPARAEEFIKLFGGKFSPVDGMESQHVQIQWKNGVPVKLGVQRKLEQIRASNQDGSTWLQVGASHLVYNMVRKGPDQDYPGFEKLKADALVAVSKYSDFFSPEFVRDVTLHYVDVIELPMVERVKLPDFFRLYPAVPEQEFGDICDYSVAVVLTPKPDTPTDVIQVVFRREPTWEKDKCRLRMEWDARSGTAAGMQEEEMASRLDRLHSRVWTCFRACFTDTTWATFGPEGA